MLKAQSPCIGTKGTIWEDGVEKSMGEKHFPALPPAAGERALKAEALKQSYH